MSEKEKLEKLLQETESYAEYNIKVKSILEGHLEKCQTQSDKLHYQREISFLVGRSMGLYMSAMTLRKMLGLKIPKDGNYQICFEEVLK